ncbi:AroM family protein [Dendrothele bispora CBS 962.96]|uniref:AroM family protein n=1 Tax=Dendrothele bispora (strain CBS 962.96) TaxID=1314807 RepID=A0A4S8LTR7_DENBC|nr:AroM family protein [Dendrothele bispora CBS 962.96]
MPLLGLITIGQSPRPDLTLSLAPLLPRVTFVERGILNDLSSSEIAQLAPSPDDPHDIPLTTRLLDGTSCIIGEQAVVRRMPSLIRALEDEERVDCTMIACTGHFPSFEHKKPLFVPDHLISFATAALAEGMQARMVGILSPVPGQMEPSKEKFAPRLDCTVRFVHAWCSPYIGTAESNEMDLRRAGRELVEKGAELIAMDCMGYTDEMRKVVAKEAGVPIVLARSVAARFAAEVLDSMV